MATTGQDAGPGGKERGVILTDAARPVERLEDFGHQISFYVRVFAGIWRVAIRYKTEVMRLLAEVSLGSGGLAVIGGTVVVVVFMTFFTGSQVGLQGYNALNQIG